MNYYYIVAGGIPFFFLCCRPARLCITCSVPPLFQRTTSMCLIMFLFLSFSINNSIMYMYVFVSFPSPLHSPCLPRLVRSIVVLLWSASRKCTSQRSSLTFNPKAPPNLHCRSVASEESLYSIQGHHPQRGRYPG